MYRNFLWNKLFAYVDFCHIFMSLWNSVHILTSYQNLHINILQDNINILQDIWP